MVLWNGDSLTRHMTQALFMLLTDDLRYGALPRFSGHRQPMFDHCQCDGQFSEHLVCRDYNQQSMYQLNDPRAYGVCTRQLQSTTSPLFAFTWSDSIWSLGADFCFADPRPRLVLLQGGAHFGSKPERFRGFLDEQMARIVNVSLACPHRLVWHAVWLGQSAQRRQLDKQYIWQTRENARSFNAEVAVHMLSKYGVRMLDTWNVTVEAASSDGFHWLSDVNLVKAMAVVHYMQDVLRDGTRPTLVSDNFTIVQSFAGTGVG